MNTSIRTLTSIALFAVGNAALAEDAINAAFERMFNHEPAAMAPAATALYRGDPVAIAIAATLSDSQHALPAAVPLADDPLVASFQRMLTHTLTPTMPPVPPGFDVDLLTVAVVQPLWGDRLAQVAQGTHNQALLRVAGDQ